MYMYNIYYINCSDVYEGIPKFWYHAFYVNLKI